MADLMDLTPIVHDHGSYTKCVTNQGISTNSTQTLTEGESEDNELYQCDICRQWFEGALTLFSHLSLCDTTYRRKRAAEKPYTSICDFCGKRYKCSGQLAIHRRIHTGEKKYKCELCGERFTWAIQLKTHRNKHTGEKPYKCDICEKRFLHSHTLMYHRRIHTGEKPYKCDFCGKCFPKSYDLTTHRRIHTGEKPYKCDICGERFAASSNFSTHKKKHIVEN